MMNKNIRRDPMEQHTGYLGTSRVVINHFDVSTQADIQHQALSYESEDEIMGRLHGGRGRRSGAGAGSTAAHYSRQDILEQYCISERGLGALENDKHSLFGCLSSHQSSPCAKQASFLTACVRQKVPSDENIYELYRRHPAEYAPYPRRARYPWAPVPPDLSRYDEDLKSSYFRRKPCADPSRYTWMPSDDESVRMEKPKSILEPTHSTQSAGSAPVKKHVSFARSHTLTSFDDAISSLSSSSSHLNRMTRSQERLLDVRKTEPQPITRQPESENIVILDKIKRTPMKTQATQTEAGLGRKPLPPHNIHLSPRTISRVKMVSQGAQTNGFIINGRKLMKSYSEAGSKYGMAPPSLYDPNQSQFEPGSVAEHELLHRTQSDEPPRSPFFVSSPPPTMTFPPPTAAAPPPVPSADNSSVSKSDEHESEDSAESKREIFIDFKPQVPPPIGTKRPLTKAVSDGQMLDQRKSDEPAEKPTSLSHENIVNENGAEQSRSFTPYFQKSPIRNEGICRSILTADTYFGSLEAAYNEFEGTGLYAQDSIDEEFHENLIYNRIFQPEDDGRVDDRGVDGDEEGEEEEEDVERQGLEEEALAVPAIISGHYASNDSLSTDQRNDQSDGIWNESQVTVLNVDSGTDNGTALSSSEMTTTITSPASSAHLLTPSSRRRHLLMLQHQQRSSMDTEVLEEEFQVDSTPLEYPRIVVDKPTSIISVTTTKKQLEVPCLVRKGRGQKRGVDFKEAMVVDGAKKTESPSQTAVVPDLLARTDSGKTNTDVSESTTTTDDYVTANSGTDSSRRSGSLKTGTLDILGDDMVVPSFSPPMATPSGLSPSRRAGSRTPTFPSSSPDQKRMTGKAGGRDTPLSDDSSSSCGSYSVGSTTPDLLLEGGGASDRLSGSGYYESPMEDDATLWKTDKHAHHHHHHRPYTLEIHSKKSPDHPSATTTPTNSGKYKKRGYGLEKSTPSPSGALGAASTAPDLKSDKPKRVKTRTRSPMQPKRQTTLKKVVAAPPGDEYKEYKATSDESSCEMMLKYAYTISTQISASSPRKNRKNKENARRKSLPRSPTGAAAAVASTSPRSERILMRDDSDEVVMQPSSLPGSLSRRKTPKAKRAEFLKDSAAVVAFSDDRTSSPSPRSKSPQKSPPEPTKLKALSAESLRSVSPGSDSVFYSDPSRSEAIAADHQVHCLHCGKEVDIVMTSEEAGANGGDHNHTHHEQIVEPPAGFEDSPRMRSTPRLYKKFERRIRSEDRLEQGAQPQRRHRYRPDVRAKSEERGAKTYRSKQLRPMAKSTDSSQEMLKATDSSPSVLPGAPEDDDDDQGVYDVPYLDGCWIYIDEQEELQAWSKSLTPSTSSEHDSKRRDSVGSTESEQEFRKRYQAITHRMVHRKSCLEMYRRQSAKSFDCDKTVVVHRQSGEFGFRIHGSKPVVVSAIEPGTPAESSGLEVGDIVLAVNGISVLDKSHSEVVKIAHAGSDTLTLEVARTCYALNTAQEEQGGNALYNGYLWKLSGYASGTTTNKWIRRWFVLKENNCLYYYKTDTEKQPVGVVMLFDHEVHKLNDDEHGLNKPHRFVIDRPDSVPLHLAADNQNARARWVEVIGKAISDSRIVDEFLEQTKRNLVVPASAISQPDCFGYLVKLGTQWKSWSRRYCVLKDACLYFYQDANAKSAFGVAYLHGYRVQQTLSGSKKHAFEIIPPDPSKKHYYFHTESDADRKRWIAALEYSIDRWLKIQ